MAPHRRERSLLEDVQELDLDRDAGFADLVEEDRAVLAAAGEDARVPVRGSGERTLLVAEELGLEERLRELGEIDAEKGADERLGEDAALLVVRDPAGLTDRRRGDPLPGPGLAEEEGGEVLHPAPERARVEPRVVSEDVRPEALAQAAHRRRGAGERLVDEIERSPELVKKKAAEVVTRFEGR